MFGDKIFHISTIFYVPSIDEIVLETRMSENIQKVLRLYRRPYRVICAREMINSPPHTVRSIYIWTLTSFVILAVYQKIFKLQLNNE